MRLKKILYILLFFVLLLAAGIFVLGRYYDHEVKSFVIQKLNQRLTAPVTIDEVELTLIDNFPQASLRFTKVAIADKLSKDHKDTLLFAEKFYLSFNFWDIIDKNYRITEMAVDGGIFNLQYDLEGNSNLNFWKEDAAGGATDFNIDLKSVNLNNLVFNFSQPVNDQYLSCFIRKANFSGNLSNDRYVLDAGVSSRIYTYQVSGIEYITNKDLESKTTLEIDNLAERVIFRNAKLTVNALRLDVDGHIDYGEKAFINLAVKGNNIEIVDVLASLPEFTRDDLKNYDATGNLDMTATLTGSLEHNYLPVLKADFSINHANLTERSNAVKLSALTVSGRFVSGFSGQNDSLWLSNASGQFSSGKFLLKGTVFNFSHPQFDGEISGKLDLNQVFGFFKWKSAEIFSGQLNINAKARGVLANPKNINAAEIGKIRSSGTAQLTNGQFKLRGARQEMKNVSAQITLSENSAKVHHLSFSTQSSDFAFSGRIDNLVPYLLQDGQQLYVDANIRSGNLNLGDFIESQPAGGRRGDSRLGLLPNVNCKLNVVIAQLDYRRFKAKQMSGLLTLDASGVSVENFDLLAFNGHMQGNLALKLSGDGFVFENKTKLDGVELDRVFYEFEDFDQNFITHKEIRGKTNATVVLSGSMDKSLDIDEKALSVTAAVKIRDGELTGLKAFEDLAAYLKTNPTVRTLVNVDKLSGRLEKVSFSTLENTITIRNSQVTIPEMAIKSSALDINVNGVHHFDNRVNYGFNFRMAEVFRKNEVTEHGYIVDDNTGLRMFISMTGTTAAPVFKYDNESAAAARKEKFQQEKATAKSLLKEELGLFRNDSTLKTLPADKKPAVRFELEEAGKAAPVTTPEKNRKAKKPAKTKAKEEYDTKEYNLDDDL